MSCPKLLKTKLPLVPHLLAQQAEQMKARYDQAGEEIAEFGTRRQGLKCHGAS